MNVHFKEWNNFEKYLRVLKENNINKIYITGQNTDPLLYKYLEELVDYLHTENFYVGVRTNGVMSLTKLDVLNKCESVSYSIHSINTDTVEKITGIRTSINWNEAISKINTNLRISVVVNRYNIDEIYDILKFLSGFEKIKYIQLRCVATDNYYDFFKEDIDLFNDLLMDINKKFPLIKDYYTSKIYEIFGKDVSLWKTIATTINSYNYFTDGIISDNYYIIEGYNKNKIKKEGNKNV